MTNSSTKETRRADEPMKLYWNQKWPYFVYYVGLGEDGLWGCYKLGQPVQFEIESARWESTGWGPNHDYMLASGFDFLGDL